ncbi:hypothetical protein E9549_05615 [Blastococcus sp. MG754426]|uniref:ATP-grasp domain-containing protein n=1 Tax=unclassified Blastococcus TaxID=2619396 RepID=UPI001EEFD73A|nr:MULTISPECIES: hypothetical protein [unclassified Blastococcus]MCF6506883.1 hypothetical protein [Blastococcus sp. MG754426]MCF6511871.1 hypothetical protein [Blastococcus sp. MG754427]
MCERVPGDPAGADEPWFVSVEVQGRVPAARPEFAAGERLDAAGAAVLERARARGLRTAVLTRRRRSYGEDVDWLVDRWLDCDTGDAGAIAAAVRSLPGRVAALAGWAQGTTGPAAVAARELGLRGPDPASPVVTGDAVARREALAAAGIPDGRWAVLRADAPAPASPVGHPCTVEVDGAGTRVGPVHDDGELRVLAARACCGPGTLSAGRLVIGEHVAGPRYAADGYVDGGAVAVHAWSELASTPPPHPAAVLLTATTRPPSPDAAPFVAAVLAACRYELGPFHLEFVLGPSGPRLVALAPRPADAGAHACVDQVSGLDTADLVVARLLDRPAPGGRAGVAASTQLLLGSHATGRVRAVSGLREAADIPGLLVAEVFADVGDAAEPASCRRAHLGHVLTVGETPRQSRRRAAAALDVIRVEIEALQPV